MTCQVYATWASWWFNGASLASNHVHFNNIKSIFQYIIQNMIVMIGCKFLLFGNNVIFLELWKYKLACLTNCFGLFFLFVQFHILSTVVFTCHIQTGFFSVTLRMVYEELQMKQKWTFWREKYWSEQKIQQIKFKL